MREETEPRLPEEQPGLPTADVVGMGTVAMHYEALIM